MDEFTAISKAREFVRKVNSSAIPVSVEAYAKELGARIKYESDMQDGEDGCSTEFNGKLIIAVNARTLPQRQRYTICHEIAHAVLGLPTEHEGASGGWRKHPNEMLCDTFAAELLLPFDKFKPLVEEETPGFSAVSSLAEAFEASLAATASRFAFVTGEPLAYILSEGGKIKYCARSRAFRDLNAWVPLNGPLPAESLSARVRGGEKNDGPQEIDADTWLANWQGGGMLMEDVRHLAAYDQALTLIWFEDGEGATSAPDRLLTFERDGLNELNGELPWPGGKKRRR